MKCYQKFVCFVKVVVQMESGILPQSTCNDHPPMQCLYQQIDQVCHQIRQVSRCFAQLNTTTSLKC
jgi:hypothetical protein